MQLVKMEGLFVVGLVLLAGISRAHPANQVQDRGSASIHWRQCPHPRGQFPHFRYCDWFYNCWDGAVFEQQCPSGLAFNPSFQYCDYPANVDCGGRAIYADSPADFLCPTPDGVFADPWDCSGFVQCAGGRASRQSCPADLLFNPKFLGCDYPHNVQCQGTSGPATESQPHHPDPRCPSGSYPHTTCQNFWACSGQQLVLMSCPAGQQFDVSCGQCRDDHLVQCHATIGTGYEVQQAEVKAE